MKKKTILISSVLTIILIATIVFLILISKLRNNTMICTYTNKNDIYNIRTEYKVSFKDNVVNYLTTKEVFESSDKDMLDEYKTSLELIYSKYNEIDNYENTITIKDNKLISITNINYEKLNLDKFVQIDQSNSKIIKDNKVSFKKLRKIYKNNGARCIYR